eukprot:5274691-Alexandrium_andersonii.AAC.1
MSLTMPMSSPVSIPCEATPAKRASLLRTPAPASGAKLAAPCWLTRARGSGHLHLRVPVSYTHLRAHETSAHL